MLFNANTAEGVQRRSPSLRRRGLTGLIAAPCDLGDAVAVEQMFAEFRRRDGSTCW